MLRNALFPVLKQKPISYVEENSIMGTKGPNAKGEFCQKWVYQSDRVYSLVSNNQQGFTKQ
jgi:hypothetical protein